MGYCPFSFCVEPRYNRLYRDPGRAASAHGKAGHGHNMATTQPTRATTQPARAQGRVAARTRIAWPWGESRYNGLYRGWGRPLCRNMQQ